MSARSKLEKVEGIAFDVALVAIAVMVATDEVQAWLFEHPRELYYGVSALHVIAVPVVMLAAVSGYGSVDKELQKPGIGVIGWAVALFFCCSFIVPVVLAMSLDQKQWVALATIFGPFVMLPIVIGGSVFAEKRGWVAPARRGEKKAWWKVQLLALVAWAYLVWMETMMLVAAEEGGPLAEVGLPLGVLVDYVPVRVMLYYVRDASRWEVLTIVASTLHLVIRLAMA